VRRGVRVGLALLALLLLPAFLPSVMSQAPLAAILSGPDALSPGAVAIFFLNATGGPGSEPGGNFSISYYITGTDLTGGAPTQSATRTDRNTNGTFRLNVTAPAKEQTVTVVAEVNSSAGATFERTTVSKTVTIVTPIVLTATFANNGLATATDVPVKFYVDGKFVGEVNLARVEPGATATATLSYLPAGLAVGQHSVRVEADLNKNGVIEPDRGEVSILDVFYRKDPDLSWGVTLTIIAAIAAVTFIVVRAIRRRRRR